ncbi:hypothetical protein AB7M16_005987 [Bradyrhizobium sp. USDA 372]
MRAQRGFRVRGSLRESNSHRPRGESPSPQPSPRKRGEGAQLRKREEMKKDYLRSLTPISAELLASWASSAESAAVWAGVPQLGSSLPSPQLRGR